MTAAHQELELKARVPDPASFHRAMTDGGAPLVFRGRMEDRRYDRNGELTATDVVLRTRKLSPDEGDPEMVLGWKGPVRISEHGYKLREELEYRIEGGASPAPMLLALGYVIVHAIDRRIEVYAHAGATLRLEQYPRMDALLEIEGPPAAIEVAIALSGIPRSEFLPDSLSAFVDRFEKRTGERALVSFPP